MPLLNPKMLLAGASLLAKQERTAQLLRSAVGVQSNAEALQKIADYSSLDRTIAMMVSDLVRKLLGDRIGEWTREAIMLDSTEQALRKPLAEYLSIVTGVSIDPDAPELLSVFFNRYADSSEALEFALIERKDFTRYQLQSDVAACEVQIERLQRAFGKDILLSLMDLMTWDIEHKEIARRYLAQADKPNVEGDISFKDMTHMLRDFVSETPVKGA